MSIVKIFRPKLQMPRHGTWTLSDEEQKEIPNLFFPSNPYPKDEDDEEDKV